MCRERPTLFLVLLWMMGVIGLKLGISVLPSIDTGCAYAGPVTDALRREDEALNRYYRELRKAGSHLSAGQKAALRSQIAWPARKQVANSVNQSVADLEKSIRKKTYDILKRELLGEVVPPWILSPNRKIHQSHPMKGKAKSPSQVSPLSPSSLDSTQKYESESLNSEPALDGSQVPREIEFTPRSK